MGTKPAVTDFRGRLAEFRALLQGAQALDALERAERQIDEAVRDLFPDIRDGKRHKAEAVVGDLIFTRTMQIRSDLGL